ncbi:MAG TPA: hypothetical protein VIV06_02895 [Candidatus Limnocylindrales bacterium]
MNGLRTLDFGAVFFGLAALLVGGFYMLRNTFGFALGDLYWDGIWPLLVVGLGASILLTAIARNARER